MIYMKGLYIKSEILKRVLNMDENERIELLLLLEEYHEVMQKNIYLRTSIRNHNFVEYSDILKNTCYYCFSHKLLHENKNNINYR